MTPPESMVRPTGRGNTPGDSKSRPVTQLGRETRLGIAEIAPGQPPWARKHAWLFRNRYEASDGDSNSRRRARSFGEGSASSQLSALIARS